MMRTNGLMYALAATLVAVLLMPANATALPVFAVNPTVSTLTVGAQGSVTFTVSGSVNSILNFTVYVTPDSLFPTYSDSDVSFPSGAALPDGIYPNPLVDSTLDPRIVFSLANTTQAPFNLAGDIFSIKFDQLIPMNLGPDSIVTFDMCASFDGNRCNIRETESVAVKFVSGDGNKVPEPATLWLAAAALVAGGLIIRKDSKSS